MMEPKIDLWFEVSAKTMYLQGKKIVLFHIHLYYLRKEAIFYCLHNDNHGSTTNDNKR